MKSHFHIPDEEMVFALLPQREPGEPRRGAMGGCSASAGSETLWVRQSSPAMGAMRCGVGLIQLASTQTVLPYRRLPPH